jgi:hypothetical protein
MPLHVSNWGGALSYCMCQTARLGLQHVINWATDICQIRGTGDRLASCGIVGTGIQHVSNWGGALCRCMCQTGEGHWAMAGVKLGRGNDHLHVNPHLNRLQCV